MEVDIPLGLYLWTRLRQQGIQSIMGVPGDMNLELLDYIKEVDGLSWVGNANELNAAYAADGYSRVKGCPGVVTTTMGVGELSALNGIGGAYTENVKVIHVVGTTPTEVQSKRLMIHHNLGPDPDHKVFEKISRHVRCAHTWLEDAETASAEIDRVIRECMVQSLPVYIFVPMDFVHVLVSATRLRTPINQSPPCNPFNETSAAEEIVELIMAAKNPVVLVDCLAARHDAVLETRQLVDVLNFPVFSTSMGKTIIDETHPRYCGVYNGEVSYPGIKQVVESSDCIINLGPLLADSNTGAHTREIRPGQVIILGPASCAVFGKIYNDVYLAPRWFPIKITPINENFPLIITVLRRVLTALQGVQLPLVQNPLLPPQPSPTDLDSKDITQSWIWKRLGRYTRAGDVLIAESGTAQFGFPDADFSSGVKYITQVYYGSIGYSVGCCLGAALAQKETQHELGVQAGRTILVVGDGSLQLTVQEIGTMIKLGLKPLLIIINNNGYTIERAIHGSEESYNDISTWRHQALLDFFGAENPRECSRQVRTKEEMENVLNLPECTSPQQIQLLEVFMGVMDIPWRLRNQIAIVNSRGAAKKAAATKAKLANGSTTMHEKYNAKLPNLAVIGGTGYIGSMIITRALQTVEAGRLGSVRVLSSRSSRPDGVPTTCEWRTVNYGNTSNIQSALSGVDIVISAAGMQKHQLSSSNKDNVITAAAAAGVKVYVPSDFGTDYIQSRYLDNSMFANKTTHAVKAKQSGLKTVSIFTGLTMERSFLRWVARDAMTWRVVGSPDATVSLTSEQDIGALTIETVLLAYKKPELVGDHVRVSSCDLTIRDYAIIYEKVRGIKIRFDTVDLEAANAAWERRKNTIPEGMIGPLIGIMIADGTFDHSRNSANDVLAKEAGGLRLRSFEDYLSQDTMRPWEGRVLDLD